MAYRDISAARKLTQGMSNLTENLNYHGLDDGVVFSLNGFMTFGVELKLISAARATPDLRERIRDRIIQSIQGALPIGAVVRSYTESRPSTHSSLGAFAPRTGDGQAIEQMLHANYRLLERMRQHGYVSDSSTYLTVTLPVKGRPKRTPFRAGEERRYVEQALALQTRLVRQLALGGMSASPMTASAVWDRIMDYHNPSMASAEKPEYQPQLDGADLAGVRWLRFVKKRPNEPMPYVPTMRAQVACSDVDLDYDACFMVGHTRVGVVSFLKPTRGTRPDATERILQALGGTHSTLIVEYIVVDAPKVRADINQALDKQETAASDPTMKAGREVYTRIAEGTNVVQAMEMGQVVTEMSMHAVIFARDQQELDDRRERTLAAFSAVGGCMPRVASSGTGIQLYLELAPFSGRRSTYKVGAYYQNAVDCVPKVSPWAGTPRGVLPLRSRSGKVFSITPLGLRNAGVVVSASSGSGKSVLISQLAAGLVHGEGASLTIVDPKRDYLPLFMALGAMDAVIRVAPDARLPSGERVCINPFDLQPGLAQPDAEKLAYLFDVFQVLRIFDRSGRRRSILQQAFTNFYVKFSRALDVDGDVHFHYTGEGTMSDLRDIVARLNTVGDIPIMADPAMRDEVRQVANELGAYCGNTPIGSLLDGPTTVDKSSRYLYLDISGMMVSQQLGELGVLLTNDLVWTRTMALEGVRVVVQEEAGVARNVPGIVELTNRLFKTGRSLGVVPILAMQEIEDALAYKGVINNASTRILLASNPSERRQIAEIFDLNEATRALHASLSGEAGRYSEALVLQDGPGNVMDGDVGQLWLSREAYWMSTSVKEEADLRAQVAADMFAGDQARAALYLAQEDSNASAA